MGSSLDYSSKNKQVSLEIDEVHAVRQLNNLDVSEKTEVYKNKQTDQARLLFWLIPYFIVLFIILAVAIVRTTPEESIRMHVFMADHLSKNHENTARIVVEHPNKTLNYADFNIGAYWMYDNKNDLPSSIQETYQYYVEKNKFLVREFSISVNKERYLANEFKIPTKVSNYSEFNNTIAVSHYPLHNNGETVISIPAEEKDINPRRLVFMLSRGNEVVKVGSIPGTFFMHPRESQSPAIQNSPEKWISVKAPAAFMMDEPNEVRIWTFENGRPYQGTIQIEQISGDKAEFPAFVEADKSGITSIQVKFKYAADFKITAGENVGYASFVINEKTLHAQMDTYRLQMWKYANDLNARTIYKKQYASVSVPGLLPHLMIDYFEDSAWLDHKIIEIEGDNFKKDANGMFMADITPVTFHVHPNISDIIYIRISTSEISTPENSQTFAMIGREMETVYGEARMVLNHLEPYRADHPELALLEKTLEAQSYYFKESGERVSKDERIEQERIAAAIRDEALIMLADLHHPNVDLRIKTESQDTIDFISAKNHHKRETIFVMIVWLLVGLSLGGIVAFRHIRERRLRWKALIASGEAEVTQALPAMSVGLAILLVIWFVGVSCGFIYLMLLL